MSDKPVTVASYRGAVEAQLAVVQLEAEGVRAFLTGDVAAGTFSGISGLGGLLSVQVPESQLERAREILSAAEGEQDQDWEAQAEAGAGVWVCTLCGEPVGEDLPACPACQTPREAVRATTPAVAQQPRRPARPEAPADAVRRRDQLTPGEPAVPEHELAESEPDLPPAETFLSDDLARRALRAAIVGCLLPCGVVTLYSLWLQLRLCLFPGELSPEATRKLYWTFLINGFMVVLVLLGGTVVLRP
jgi:hypothetical protein